MKTINICMAEFKVVRGAYIIETHGIGSCVAITFFDSKTKNAGIAHIMLPSSDIAKNGINPLRFADKAIDAVLQKMHQKGSKKKDITAKIFGGVNMFVDLELEDHMEIGKNNIVAVKKKLKQEHIRIVAQDTGGNDGRWVWFNAKDGRVVVGKPHSATKEY